jgi:hypothetical protein
VEVRDLLDGRVVVFHDGPLVAQQPAPADLVYPATSRAPAPPAPRPSRRSLRWRARRVKLWGGASIARGRPDEEHDLPFVPILAWRDGRAHRALAQGRRLHRVSRSLGAAAGRVLRREDPCRGRGERSLHLPHHAGIRFAGPLHAHRAQVRRAEVGTPGRARAPGDRRGDAERIHSRVPSSRDHPEAARQPRGRGRRRSRAPYRAVVAADARAAAAGAGGRRRAPHRRQRMAVAALLSRAPPAERRGGGARGPEPVAGRRRGLRERVEATGAGQRRRAPVARGVRGAGAAGHEAAAGRRPQLLEWRQG